MLYRFLHQFKIAHVLDRNLVTERSWLFRQVHRQLRKINIVRTVTRRGVTFKVPIHQGTGFANFIASYEPWFDTLLHELLPTAGSTFLDIGANTGQTLLKVVPHFPKVTFYAVEPNDHCIQYLQKLCTVNDFTQVTICPYALADAPGNKELLIRYQDDILATTSPDFRKYTKYARRMSVPALTGDTLIQRLSPKGLDFVKIDVEGGEAQVVAGLHQTLAAFQPFVLCEILPLHTEDADVTAYRKRQAQQLLTTLLSLGYQCWNVITKAAVSSIDDLSPSLESSNYLFVPQGKSLDAMGFRHAP